VQRILGVLYGFSVPEQPQSRNEIIRTRYQAGESQSDLAREYGITPQRVYQIVRGRRK
jgi:Mor family transcriptional regulator